MFTKIGNRYIANQEKGINRMKKHPRLTGFLATAVTVSIVIQGITLIRQIEEETNVMSNALRRIGIGKKQDTI